MLAALNSQFVPLDPVLPCTAVLQSTLPRSTPASKGPDYTVAVHPFDEVNGNEPFVSTRPDNEIDIQTATFRFSISGGGRGRRPCQYVTSGTYAALHHILHPTFDAV